MLRCIFRPAFVLCLTLFCVVADCRAQVANAAARETEWQSYKLPSTDFARHVDESRALLVRVPAEWQQQQAALEFNGPDGITLQAVVEQVPEGVPLKSYVASLLQQLRDLATDPDSLVVRRTQMSGYEAREIIFELLNEKGVMTRRVIWTAVAGPRAISLILIAPLSQTAKAEPVFKAVVESAIIIDDQFYLEFDLKRAAVIKQNKPARIDEMISLVAALEGNDQAAREKATAMLASALVSSPDPAIDLLLHRNAMVRASIVDAIGLSRNSAFVPFLLFAISRPDSFVADRAAKALAHFPDSLSLLRKETNDWSGAGFQETLRASAYFDSKGRAQIAAELFKQAESQKPSPLPPPVVTKRPAPAKRPTPAKRAKATKPAPDIFKMVDPRMLAPDPTLFRNKQFIATNLLRNLPASDFKMPLAEIVAARNDHVIASALAVALDRREQLPLDELFKLLGHAKEYVQFLAARNIAQSPAAAVPRIEAYIVKLSPPASPAASDNNLKAKNKSASGVVIVRANQMSWLVDELRLSINKINLRAQIMSAEGKARDQIIKQAMEDAQLADWVWTEFVRDEQQRLTEKTAPGQTDQPRPDAAIKDITISPLGENLFPAKVTLYAALPDPSAAFNKLGDSLANLQMDSARGQANFVLLLSSLKEGMKNFLEAQPDDSILDSTGIKSTAPVAVATWRAEGAPRGPSSAYLKAVLVRVGDRDRFERLLSLYQRQMGGFAYLPEVVSAGTRFIGFAPALLPLGGALAFAMNPGRRNEQPMLRFHLITHDQCDGYPVKVIERREASPHGGINVDPIYLAYVGDAAILTSDIFSLRDCLSRLRSNGPSLASNSHFKRAVAASGDAIYLSDLGDLFASTGSSKPSGDEAVDVAESGALKISNSAWENSFELSFKQREWTRLLLPFQPQELVSPRELLPASTLAYFFMKADVARIWQEWGRSLFVEDSYKEAAKLWAVDFDKEVLPEIGPEAGAALLGLPSQMNEGPAFPWVIFFKLKSDKLASLMREGKLLKGATAGASFAQIKFSLMPLVVGVKNGFLVLASDETSFNSLDLKEKLDGARDFARAAKSAPSNVVAFGGYNLEATVAQIGSLHANDPQAGEFINVLTSMVRAFHSQNFYATASADGLNAHMSVSLDREGRYSVGELSSLSKDFRLAFAVIEARGRYITDQQRLESLTLRLRAKNAGVIDRIKEDIASAYQSVKRTSENELLVTVRPRTAVPDTKLLLPVAGAEFAPFLKPSPGALSNDKSVVEKAREIAGGDRNAWSVARKLADWTFKNLKWKRVDDADAAQTLATREADCYEFSQLFIAMARSLGLPARMVSGIAHMDGYFGGHAWVEVFVGQWVELDPTWGAHFADPTHIRTVSSELLGYAVLNLVEIEVLEAPRAIPDYQRDPTALVQKICEEAPVGAQSSLGFALDIAALTDAHMGAGAWDQMSDAEREQMWAAWRRLISEMSTGYLHDASKGPQVRLLKINQTSDKAEALVITPDDYSDALEKFYLARKDGLWTITEVIYADTDYRVVVESLTPVIQAILARRSGKPVAAVAPSAQKRGLTILTSDAKTALEIAELALKQEPASKTLRHLKAFSLYNLDKEDEAIRIWTELGNEQPPYVPALYKLAIHYEDAEEEQKAIEFFERYIALMPDDPRALSSLAILYKDKGDKARAEAYYRAAIKADPRYSYHYIDLGAFFASERRYADALNVIDEGVKTGATKDEMFSSLLRRFYLSEQNEITEALVLLQPDRMTKNAAANYYLALAREIAGRASDALPLAKKAIELNPQDVDYHLLLASLHRKLRNWTAALAAADKAIQLDANSIGAHYNRACALARLGRLSQAMIALKRMIELSPISANALVDEEDLKALSRLPEFKKLLPQQEPEKQ